MPYEETANRLVGLPLESLYALAIVLIAVFAVILAWVLMKVFDALVTTQRQQIAIQRAQVEQSRLTRVSIERMGRRMRKIDDAIETLAPTVMATERTLLGFIATATSQMEQMEMAVKSAIEQIDELRVLIQQIQGSVNEPTVQLGQSLDKMLAAMRDLVVALQPDQRIEEKEQDHEEPSVGDVGAVAGDDPVAGAGHGDGGTATPG